MKYRLSLELFRLYNSEVQNEAWMDMNVQQNVNQRQKFVHLVDHSRLRIGKKNLTNRMTRLTTLNEMVNLDLLNLSYDAFKIKMKILTSL